MALKQNRRNLYYSVEATVLVAADVNLHRPVLLILCDIDHQLVVAEGQLRGVLLPRNLLALVLLDYLYRQERHSGTEN